MYRRYYRDASKTSNPFPTKHCLKIGRRWCIESRPWRGYELRMKCTGSYWWPVHTRSHILFFLSHPQFDARLWKKLNEHSRRCRVDVPRRCANKTSTTRLISQGTIIISADRCPIPDVLLSTWFASIETRHATPIDTQMFQNCYISMCQCNTFYLNIILICEDIVIEVLFKIRTYRSIGNIF